MWEQRCPSMAACRRWACMPSGWSVLHGSNYACVQPEWQPTLCQSTCALI
jgi:hypothetical protein